LDLRGKQTVMIIAHRLQDIAMCDHVVVLDQVNCTLDALHNRA
jgi:ABC-type multidrug transport system fused ATPase/permease subunit